MGQETATYINSLNEAWPLSTDLIRYGSVHLRTIKGAIKATFPSLTGAVTLTHSQINDAARLSVRNIFTTTVSGALAPIQLESTQPGILLKETDADLDEKIWRLFAADGQLKLGTLKDDGTGQLTVFTVDRTANTPDLFTIAMAALVQGNIELTGALNIGHASDTTLARSRAGVLSMEGIEMGFLGMPINSKSADYDLVLSDAGKCILHPSGGGANDDFTIPANATVAFPAETLIGFLNMDSNELEINIATDTLQALGSGDTGPFFLPQYCFAVAYKHASTSWIIGGQGLHT